MRRTLVSRKARKRRIAENAEMSGENFYNRQMAAKVDVAPVGTTYDQKAPLTRAASTTANGSTLANGNTYSPVNRRPQPEPIGYPRPAPTPPVNDYSSSQQNSYGSPYAIRSDPNLRNQFSNTSMRSARSDGPLYPPRGRGGFPPRGRGRPYGGPPGFAPGNGRGGMRPGPSRRGRGGPPVGYPPQNRGYPPLNDYSGYGPGPTLGGRGAPIENSGPRNVNPTMNTNLGRQAMEMHPSSETVPEARTVARDDPGLIENPKSPTSVYSADAPYVPPRSNWRQQEQPVGQLSTDQPRPPMSPLEPSAQPRDMTRTPPLGAPYPPSSYYEDVEPQFALPMTGVESADVPTTLVPGSFGEPPLRTFFDEFPGGPRSPADTESSHFTSISQRGINPQWRPPGSESAKASVQHRQDVLLSNNPDFALPTGRARANTGVGGRMPAPTPMPTIPGTPTGYRTDGIHFF
ncbi:regulator of ime2 [Emydomyces testavorans]|uniref:Regulator of ime2 n=1 Tax=Emydomyces testavorans TaxID=2070801 RepID=A0AAF0DK49_9EURO|nr:regulator of ime2 [Emydomyces testavorans]